MQAVLRKTSSDGIDEENPADYYAIDASALNQDSSGGSKNDDDDVESEEGSPQVKLMNFADLGVVAGWTEEDEIRAAEKEETIKAAVEAGKVDESERKEQN